MKILAAACLGFCATIWSTDQVFAQTARLSSESFDYFSCSEMMKPEEVEGFFFGVNAAIKVYNEQNNVDVKMVLPSKEQCYVSVGRPGTLFGGVPFVNFYTTYPHFECSVRGDCVGDLAGYQATVNFKKNSAQFTANTYKVDDMVMLCFEGGRMNSGPCE